METVLIRKPTVEETFRLVETQCVYHVAKAVCTAPPDYKCAYRRIKPFEQ